MTERLLELLIAIGLPAVVVLLLLTDEILVVLYGRNDFLSASPALRIMVWNLVFVAITQALGQMFLAGRRERVTLRIVVIDIFVTLALGFVLINHFGLIGAAVTTLVTAMVDWLQHSLMASKLFPPIAVGRLFWKPVIAAGCMGVYLIAFRDHSFALRLLSAPIIYTALLFCLCVWSSGGVHQARVRYEFLWLQVRS